MLNSGESFGLGGRGGFGAPKVGSSGGNYLRETIKDDFLNENDDEDEDIQSLRSAESGEILPNHQKPSRFTRK